jgi:hypothetical protein
MIRNVLFVVGLASIVTGVGLWSVPSAFIVGGVLCVAAGIFMALAGMRNGEQ